MSGNKNAGAIALAFRTSLKKDPVSSPILDPTIASEHSVSTKLYDDYKIG